MGSVGKFDAYLKMRWIMLEWEQLYIAKPIGNNDTCEWYWDLFSIYQLIRWGSSVGMLRGWKKAFEGHKRSK